MRFLGVVAAALLTVAGVAAVSGPAGAANPTIKSVVRPVTSAGNHAPGFTVTAEPSGSVDCSSANPSPGAVSPNIEFCFPSAEYAVACWRSSLANRVLCMRNPLVPKLVRIPRMGAFAPTPPPTGTNTAPLVMRLGDGDLCALRSGGAFGQLPGHPNLYATYYCAQDGAVWAHLNPVHWGVNESNPVWTVRTAHLTDHTLVTRHVVRAWFVGTTH